LKRYLFGEACFFLIGSATHAQNTRMIHATILEPS